MVLQPRDCRNSHGLGSAAFAHHYSRYHCCFLFLPLLRCFSSGGSPPHKVDDWPSASRVAPFGHPGINAHLQLPLAFRSLSRPSSPPGATGIPHAPFLSFLVPFFAFLRPCGLFRSILSTRFLSLRLAGTAALDPCGEGRPFSLRVPNMSMTSFIVEDNGLEPLTPCLQSRCSTS